MRKMILPTTSRRTKVDAVTKIVKQICGMSQSEAFTVAKNACEFNPPKRCAAGTSVREG